MDENDKNSTNLKGGNRKGRPKKNANAKSKEVCISKEDQAAFAKFAQEDAKAKAATAKSRNAKSAKKNANPKVANADQKDLSEGLPTLKDISSVSEEHTSVDSKSTKETEDELTRKAQALAEFTFWNCVTYENGSHIPLMPPDFDDEGLSIDIIANGVDPELLEMVIKEINERIEEFQLEATMTENVESNNIDANSNKPEIDAPSTEEDRDLDLEQNDQSDKKDDLDLEQSGIETAGDPIIPKFK